MYKYAILLITLAGNDSVASIEKGIENFKSKNYAAAYEEFAIATDNPRAMYFLGAMYDQGLHIEKNETKALQLLKNSSRLGNLASTLYLAEKGEPTGYFDNIPKLEKEKAALEKKLNPGNKNDILWKIPKHYLSGERVKNDLLDRFLDLEKAINKEKEKVITLDYVNYPEWKSSDAIITFAITKEANSRYSLLNSFKSPPEQRFLIRSSWSYKIPISPVQKSTDTSIYLAFQDSNNNGGSACENFPNYHLSRDKISIDYSHFFKLCTGVIFVQKGENDREPFIHIKFSLDRKFIGDYERATELIESENSRLS